ncbi:beta-galactosidase trimerization domain-containing protein, partial [Candidatus Bathyarchaeota archaeon]|nr:beta-galactosidase trimerization domain-containing protein [Candidatus Bathyarchaeota archaeon]
FWVMELQSGIFFLGKTPRPGEIRKWTYQAISHGANGVLYFRWRTTPYGVEQFVYGIPGPDNRLDRRYYEVKRIGEEVRRLEEYVCETTCKSNVAILCSYDNIWSSNMEKDDYGKDFLDDMLSVYKGLWLNHIPVDIVEPSYDLTKYKIIFTPFFYIMNGEVASKLKDYVNSGGILVSDARLAVKNEYNGIFSEPLPGLLTDLFGITIDDFDLVENVGNRKILCTEEAPILKHREILPTTWVEALRPLDKDVVTIAIHKVTWLDGRSAITMHEYGKGKAIYVGTFFSTELVDMMVKDFINNGLIQPIATLNDSYVEIMSRNGRNFSLLFVINHSESYKKVEIRLEKMYNVEEIFDQQHFKTNVLKIDLKPDDVKVLIIK